MPSTEQRSRANGQRVDGEVYAGTADTMLQVSVPPGTPREAERAIRRLLELTTVLARRASQLQEALDSRVVIEQAKGVLAERYSITVDEAFKLLRHAARSNRFRIHDVAARVVSSEQTPPEFDGAGVRRLVER